MRRMPSVGEVCLLGVGIVFIGLICIVLLCYVVGAICRVMDRKRTESAPATLTNQDQEIPNRQEFVAAVSAAIAEELGADVSAIRIVSIRRM